MVEDKKHSLVHIVEQIYTLFHENTKKGKKLVKKKKKKTYAGTNIGQIM